MVVRSRVPATALASTCAGGAACGGSGAAGRRLSDARCGRGPCGLAAAIHPHGPRRDSPARRCCSRRSASMRCCRTRSASAFARSGSAWPLANPLAALGGRVVAANAAPRGCGRGDRRRRVARRRAADSIAALRRWSRRPGVVRRDGNRPRSPFPRSRASCRRCARRERTRWLPYDRRSGLGLTTGTEDTADCFALAVLRDLCDSAAQSLGA